jgi:hypothetical protein
LTLTFNSAYLCNHYQALHDFTNLVSHALIKGMLPKQGTNDQQISVREAAPYVSISCRVRLAAPYNLNPKLITDEALHKKLLIME